MDTWRIVILFRDGTERCLDMSGFVVEGQCPWTTLEPIRDAICADPNTDGNAVIVAPGEPSHICYA